MARLIDERPEDETQETNEELLSTEETPEVEQPEEQPQQDDELPEKYQGKTAAELARMHQEAEKLLGRQSSEVGELRKVVDSYIQTQLTPAAPEEPEDDVDFFSDPERAVERAIAKHPKIREAEAVTQQYKQSTAMSQLQSRHPDMQNILQDAKFAEWIQASKIRTQLFAQADSQYDYEAADELFTLWKERQGAVAQTVAAEKAGRKQSVKSASTGNARGNPDSSSKKTYRRSDIIKLMKTDPERYLSISDEIMQAYSEGRVK
jgi:hypothetical protein